MKKPDPLQGIESIAFLPLGIYMLISGLKGSNILEKGITSSGRFLTWNRIESYEWEGWGNNTLTIKLKRPLFLFRKLSLPIPPHNKEELDKLLTENIAKSA